MKLDDEIDQLGFAALEPIRAIWVPLLSSELDLSYPSIPEGKILDYYPSMGTVD
jgi:hypothetical protein